MSEVLGASQAAVAAAEEAQARRDALAARAAAARNKKTIAHQILAVSDCWDRFVGLRTGPGWFEGVNQPLLRCTPPVRIKYAPTPAGLGNVANLANNACRKCCRRVCLRPAHSSCCVCVCAAV